MRRLVLLPVLVLLAAPAASQEEADPAAASQEEADPAAASQEEADPAAASQEEADPAAASQEIVESFHEVLLGCMQEGETLGFQGRYDRILASLDASFDLPFMARTAVSTAWNDLSREQRIDFVALSRRLSATRYADNFSGFGGESFETLSVEPAARGTMLVKTRFNRPAEEPVLFNYRLRTVGDQWRIIDVQLDGKISELALRRGQYRSVIEREGFEKLVEKLEKQIAELSAQ